MVLNDPHLSLVFGILGNAMSFLIYLAPLPTFYRIFMKKTTEEFRSLPYSVGLFSAMLTLYYGILKDNDFMLITINSVGCVIESVYLIMFMIYATKVARIYTTKLLVLFNIGAFASIVLFTKIFSHGDLRINIVGWICAIFSVCVFAAPLSIMKQVIITKSVEFMPLSLSFFLTLCAVCWLFYGLSLQDYFIATPNFLGLALGFAQMIFYFIYNKKNEVLPSSIQEIPNIDKEGKKYGDDHSKPKDATDLQM